MPRDEVLEEWLRENNEHYNRVCEYHEGIGTTINVVAESNLAIAKEVARLSKHLSDLSDLSNLVRI